MEWIATRDNRVLHCEGRLYCIACSPAHHPDSHLFQRIPALAGHLESTLDSTTRQAGIHRIHTYRHTQTLLWNRRHPLHTLTHRSLHQQWHAESEQDSRDDARREEHQQRRPSSLQPQLSLLSATPPAQAIPSTPLWRPSTLQPEATHGRS